MPTTLGGLLIFVLLLVPGFIHYVQRRSQVPQRTLSPLVETANLATVSVVTNALAIAAFGLARIFLPDHSPDIGRFLIEGTGYAAPRLGYLLLWGGGLLAFSSALALALGSRPHGLRALSTRFAPAIVDVSAWYHVFEEGPVGDLVYVGCDLQDGSYVGGLLDWYSTAVEETADRDLCLAEPLTFQPAGGEDELDPEREGPDEPEPEEPQVQDLEGVSRVVVSAREVSRMYVSYLSERPTADTAD